MAFRGQRRSRRDAAGRVSADVADAVARIRAWGEVRDWRGYDPYDALNSPAARRLTLDTALGARVLTQIVKLAPINLRPALGIRPDWNAKAIALVASGYARLAAAGDGGAGPEARRWLEWLVEHHAESVPGLGWGYHFDVRTRFFGYARGTPNAIATSFAGQALLDGCELLGDNRWREPARRVAQFLVAELLTVEAAPYFRYLAHERELVHNANLLACGVLARAARVLEDPELAEPARAALATSLPAQRPDGAWPYADGPGHDWVDNFHTGYVLESLALCAGLQPSLPERISRGVHFWERELFLSDGTPKYDLEHVFPLDAHCYATAIDTWLAVSPWHESAQERAERISALLVERMLDPRGFVRFQRHRFWTSNVPFIRWTTAPSFRALAGLLLARVGHQAATQR
jgi:polysaccharide biosynthesis protein VpsJ